MSRTCCCSISSLALRSSAWISEEFLLALGCREGRCEGVDRAFISNAFLQAPDTVSNVPLS